MRVLASLSHPLSFLGASILGVAVSSALLRADYLQPIPYHSHPALILGGIFAAFGAITMIVYQWRTPASDQVSWRAYALTVTGTALVVATVWSALAASGLPPWPGYVWEGELFAFGHTWIVPGVAALAGLVRCARKRRLGALLGGAVIVAGLAFCVSVHTYRWPPPGGCAAEGMIGDLPTEASP